MAASQGNVIYVLFSPFIALFIRVIGKSIRILRNIHDLFNRFMDIHFFLILKNGTLFKRPFW